MTKIAQKTVEFAKNKKAYSFYDIFDKIEGGIQLTGGEVKSIKAGNVNLKGSYVTVEKGGAWLKHAHISPYKYDALRTDPDRDRKLLFHKEELLRIEQKQKEKGITVIPLEIYAKKALIKVLIGVCRGKKMHDRREDLKKKAQNLDIKRALKKFGR